MTSFSKWQSMDERMPSFQATPICWKYILFSEFPFFHPGASSFISHNFLRLAVRAAHDPLQVVQREPLIKD